MGSCVLGGDDSASEERRLVRLLARGAGGVLLLQTASALLAFCNNLLLARVLGTADFGLYAYALSWTDILVVLGCLRANALVVRQVSRYQAKGEPSLFRGLIRRVDQIVLVAASALALGAALVAAGIGGDESALDPATFDVAMAMLPFMALTLIRESRLEGLHRVVRARWPNVAFRQGLFALIVGLAWLSRSSMSSVDAMGIRAAVTVLASLVVAILARNALPEEVKGATPAYAMPEWRASLIPLFVAGVLMTTSQQADTLLLGMLCDASDLGVYAAARRLALLSSYVLVATNTSFGPVAARLHARGQLPELQRVASKTAALSTLTSVPLTVVLLVWGDTLLGYFGEGFVVGRTALAILAVAQLVNAATGPVGTVLIMTGEERKVMVGMGVSVVVGIVLNLLLIPAFGIEGAALASGVGTTLWNLLLLAFLVRKHGIHTTAWGVWRRADSSR
ncbi:MAG: oligosaccharide flippase family protein [Deltaproteobacteria bacterium]|nr:oligosaccharide flippase family protein [Deltaproteobacteria bacterium]